MASWFTLAGLLMALPHWTAAQDGPGGIQNTTGASNLLLWLDAHQIDSVFDQNNLTTWHDASGHGNHFTQANANSKPNFRENEVNGFPAVHFDGGERLEGTFSGGLSAPITAVAVTFFDSLNQGAGNFDYVFSAGSNTGSHTMLNLARFQADATNGDKFYHFDGTNSNFGPVLTGQQWTLLTHVHQATATFHALYVDGTSETVDNLMSNALNTDANARVGDWADSPSAAYHLNGSIAEIVLFDKVLNTAEQQILHSYLGAKYAIANSDDRYTGDDPGNGDHDRDVIGIGTESDGSNTQALAAGLQLSQNSNFGNGDYLLAGHATTENTVNTTDVGGGFAARWDRTWWLDVTDAGSAMTVDFTFDLSEGGLGGSADGTTVDYQLVFRSGTSGSWTAQATATSVSGDQVRFTNVSLTTDGQYTLATLDNSGNPLGENPGTLGCDGPGGIGSTDGSSDLELWLDAESLLGADEDPLVSFYDQSGNGHHADELDPVNIPVIKTAVCNGMDAIRFDGNDYIQGDLGAALSAQATILAVATFHNDQGAGENDYVLSLGNPTTTNRHVSISRRRSDVAADHNKYYSWDGNSTRFGPVISTNAWNIFHQEHNTSAPFHSLYLDGAAQSVADYSSGFSATATDYRLGHWLNGFTNGIDGDIAEVIIFDRLLNSAERNILTAYLGAKFNISVTDDVYAGDDAGNSDHDREVAGIGTESDGSNTCAASGGLRMAQNSNFGNGDYVVFGHNVVTNRSQDTDIAHGSATLEERWERVWWVDVTDAGAALTVDITFDFSEADIPGIYPNGSATNYQLLFRSGTTGSWSTLATATSLSGDQIAFNNVAITADGQYTLATLAAIASPLPIELLHFGAALHEPHNVLLTWETATETNNDHFTVEKSRNGSVFATVGHQPGAGESRERRQYRMVDPAPYAGTSYYRLKQTDRNGTVSYSHLAPVHVEQQANIRVFPNPATDHLTIACHLSAAAQAQLEVWTPDGRLQAVAPLPLTSGSNQVKLPVNAWSHGWHILRISGLDRPYYFRVFRE